jgi:hypothetical protein
VEIMQQVLVQEKFFRILSNTEEKREKTSKRKKIPVKRKRVQSKKLYKKKLELNSYSPIMGA